MSNCLINTRLNSCLSKHHQLNELDDHSLNGRLSKSNFINDKSSLKNFKCNRKLPLDKPLSNRKLKNSDYLLSKSAHNLNSNCLDHSFNNDIYSNAAIHYSNQNNSDIIARLQQMEQQMDKQSAKLFNFERKIEELNRENTELTQTLLSNSVCNKACNNPFIKLNDAKNENYVISLKQEIASLKERLNVQAIFNSNLEKESQKLSEKMQLNQTKLIETEEKYEHLIQMKNRELDGLKLKLEQLSNELDKKEEETKQLELDKQHLNKKVIILNQVSDKQDEKLEQHNNQLNKLELDISNLRNDIKCKDIENDKLRKELILTKNSLKKIQNLNSTNENLIVWLNKQLTDSQSKYNLLYPKPNQFKKSTSINLQHQRPLDYCEGNLSEALSDSHLQYNRLNLEECGNNCENNYRNGCDIFKSSSTDYKISDYRNEFNRNQLSRNEFHRNDYGNECKNDCKNDYPHHNLKLDKNDFKNDYKIIRQFQNGNSIKHTKSKNLNNLENRRLDYLDHHSSTNLKLSPSNYLPSNLIFANNKRLNDVEQFSCTLGK